MARLVGLVYNWWTLLVRLAQPYKHCEAISSRPLVQYGIATRRQHAVHTGLTITSLHTKRATIQAVLTNLAGLLRTLKTTAEQWTDAKRLRLILARAVMTFLFSTASPPGLQSCTDRRR